MSLCGEICELRLSQDGSINGRAEQMAERWLALNFQVKGGEICGFMTREKTGARGTRGAQLGAQRPPHIIITTKEE